MNNSPDETDQDPAPLKEADAERDTSEQAEEVSNRPTEPADDDGDQDD